LSGDTFRKISNFQWENKSKAIQIEKIKNKDIIFCESELLPELVAEVLSKINVDIKLILGNSDHNHSGDNLDLDKIPHVSSIFAQNLESNGTGARVLPIGIENSWRSNHGKLKYQICRESSTQARIHRIMWGFNLGTNLIERTNAANALVQCKVADKIAKVIPKEHQNYLQKYAFVACPPGNGLDTHRTWEALYFKCVPIVLRSFMTEEYKLLGLPVWVVDSYDEVISINEEFLETRYKELSQGFGSDRIWAEFWISAIRGG
jgi:hypothetical protein